MTPTRHFDELPFIVKPNPLPCGCAVVGVEGINRDGTATEYRNLQIRFCPKHAAAPALLEAFKGCLAVVTTSAPRSMAAYGDLLDELRAEIEAAIAAAEPS